MLQDMGPQHADTVLLIATTMDPAKRLGSEAEGKAWLDAAAVSSFFWWQRLFWGFLRESCPLTHPTLRSTNSPLAYPPACPTPRLPNSSSTQFLVRPRLILASLQLLLRESRRFRMTKWLRSKQGWIFKAKASVQVHTLSISVTLIVVAQMAHEGSFPPNQDSRFDFLTPHLAFVDIRWNEWGNWNWCEVQGEGLTLGHWGMMHDAWRGHGWWKGFKFWCMYWCIEMERISAPTLMCTLCVNRCFTVLYKSLSSYACKYLYYRNI